MHGLPIIVTSIQPERPEQTARRIIDDNLRAAGWEVQSADDIDVSASLGVAVAELPMEGGLADYALFLDRTTVGVIEAKAHGARMA